MFCVRQSSVRGCRFSFVFVYFIIKVLIVLPFPGRGGRGGVERSLVGTPRPARGDGGMWRVGRGREPWERSEAGGVIGNERHLHRSPVSSPTEAPPRSVPTALGPAPLATVLLKALYK